MSKCERSPNVLERLPIAKSQRNPEFDINTVLTDLTYCLCSIRSLPVSLTSHKSVRSIFAAPLINEASTESVDALKGKWQKQERIAFDTLQSKLNSHELSDVDKLVDLPEEQLADQLTELANRVADRSWTLEERELRGLLSCSVEIIRARLKFLQLKDGAGDRSPAAEAWFCFMMAVWSCLRDLVTEPDDEAEKFRACIDFSDKPVSATKHSKRSEFRSPKSIEMRA